MLINREYGMVQRYPKSREKAPELIREWALTISREWRYLMAASNVTMVTADEFQWSMHSTLGVIYGWRGVRAVPYGENKT